MTKAVVRVFSDRQGVNGASDKTCVCADTFSENVDYFPQKMVPSFSKGFTISYHKTYKIINNTAATSVYVGYQCGAPKPTVEMLGFTPTAFVELPVARIGVLSTTELPWVEFLGDRESIKVVDTPAFVSSPCLQRLIQEGSIVNKSGMVTADLDATFCTAGWGCDSVPPEANPVPIAAHTESSLLGTAEWIQYIAAFFNREAAAKDVINSVSTMMDCHVSSVKPLLTNVAQKPKVLWAYYSDYPGWEAWYPGTCPNYYCELIEKAGGEVMSFDSPPGNNHSAFFEVAKSADVWFYAGTNWGKLPSFNLSSHLAATTAVVNNAVYDFQKAGQYDWFESRMAEPDVVLEDVISIVHPAANQGHERVWWRKVDGTEEIGGVKVAKCADTRSPLVLKADACKSGDGKMDLTKPSPPSGTLRAEAATCLQPQTTTTSTTISTTMVKADPTTPGVSVTSSETQDASLSIVATPDAAALVVVCMVAMLM